MKKFVYKLNQESKELFYYVDDVDGDLFVEGIQSARIFTEKQIKDYDLVVKMWNPAFILEISS